MPQTYAHPEFLVDAQWAADRLNDPTVRIVESDEELQNMYQAQGITPDKDGSWTEWDNLVNAPIEK